MFKVQATDFIVGKIDDLDIVVFEIWEAYL